MLIGEPIVYVCRHPASVCLSTILKDISSETVRPILFIFHFSIYRSGERIIVILFRSDKYVCFLKSMDIKWKKSKLTIFPVSTVIVGIWFCRNVN